MVDELLWQLFALSARSANSDGLIRPFPQKFIKNGVKNFDELSSEIDQRSDELSDFLKRSLAEIVPVKSDKLIRSLFLKKKTARPDYVFVDGAEGAGALWHARVNGYGSTTLCFHGSKPENFYSILQHGLVQCLNKRNLFGDGTYLSTEAEIALEFAPAQLCPMPERGIRSIRCVALCEVADGAPGVASSITKKGTPQAYIVVSNDDCVIGKRVY